MKKMESLVSLLVLAISLAAVASPNFFTYSSYLTDSNRKPRALTGQMVYFRLFADSTGETKIWEEPHGVVAPNGFISVQLGTNPVYPLPVRQIQSAQALWLEMQIYGEKAFPRQKIATSFFTIAANYADSASHAMLADSAKHAAHAVNSDTAAYARGGSTVVSAQKSDTANKAGVAVYADSAGRARFAHNTTLSDSAVRSGKAANADSLGGIAARNYSQKSEVPAIKVLNSFRSDTALYAMGDLSKVSFSGNFQVAANSTDYIKEIQISTGVSGIFMIYVHSEVPYGRTDRKAIMVIPGTHDARRAWIMEEGGYNYVSTRISCLIQPHTGSNSNGYYSNTSHRFQVSCSNTHTDAATVYWYAVQIAP